jgi:hypothetical protein
MKPIVRYIAPAKPHMDRAILIPINHRNHVAGQGATNGREAITSRVIAWDQRTGHIETLHTLYMPLADSDDDDEMVQVMRNKLTPQEP